MNSYILTFKKKVLIAIGLVFFLILLLDLSLVIFSKYKTTKKSFLAKRDSKIQHFLLNDSYNKDIIFIGTSRTMYHISTNIFKQAGLNVANLGIPGGAYEDYPTLVKRILHTNPKKIVISLHINEFYTPLRVWKSPGIEEMKFYFDIDKIKFIQSLFLWIRNQHTFLIYSESIYSKIKGFYSKFDNSKNPLEEQHLQNSDSTIIPDCTVFERRGNKEVRCENGDGILFGNNLDLSFKEKIKIKNYDINSIKYFNKLIQKIKDKNIEVIVILEPIFHNEYIYNLNDLKDKLNNIEILDLTNLKIDNSAWSENSHLNIRGRDIYSKYLLNHLK